MDGKTLLAFASGCATTYSIMVFNRPYPEMKLDISFAVLHLLLFVVGVVVAKSFAKELVGFLSPRARGGGEDLMSAALDLVKRLVPPSQPKIKVTVANLRKHSGSILDSSEEAPPRNGKELTKVPPVEKLAEGL